MLETGEAGPNDQVGPQSALAFTLTNEKLANKLDIVKALLAFGADTSVLNNTPELRPEAMRSPASDASDAPSSTRAYEKMLERMDPATRCVIGSICRSVVNPSRYIRCLFSWWNIPFVFDILSLHLNLGHIY